MEGLEQMNQIKQLVADLRTYIPPIMAVFVIVWGGMQTIKIFNILLASRNLQDQIFGGLIVLLMITWGVKILRKSMGIQS